MALAIVADYQSSIAKEPPTSLAGVALGASKSEVIWKYPKLKGYKGEYEGLSVAVIASALSLK